MSMKDGRLRPAALQGLVRAARVAVAVAMAMVSGLAGLAVLAGSAAAATPTVNCDTAANPSSQWTTCQQLVGTASCAWDNGDGTWTIALGYRNPTADNLFASIPPAPGGANNALTATGGFASNPNHVSTFWTGTSVTAFTVTWRPARRTDAVSWELMGKTYTWDQTSVPACAAVPVPIIGSVAAAGVALLLAVAAFAIANRRRIVEDVSSPVELR